MAARQNAKLLPPSQLEQQLSAIDLLLSMFSLDGELEVSESTTISIEKLRQYVENPSSANFGLPPSIEFMLNVPVDPEHQVDLQVRFLLETTGGTDTNPESDEPPLPVVNFRCPPWMNRKAHADVASRMPVDSPDSILMVVEFLKEELSIWLASSAESTSKTDGSDVQAQELVRVWFYLQSLSTRSKRNDLVQWAPNYGLTGFVLAGKPGILCLEGTSDNIYTYMSEIKTRSWSDIPSHQKKVSERYREEGPEIQRVFKEMREVTGEISKGGHRGNRGEMGEVKRMFEKVGLEDVFAEVIGL